MFIQREIRSFGFFFWEELYVLCKSKTEQTIKPHAQNNHVATTFICQRKDNKWMNEMIDSPSSSITAFYIISYYLTQKKISF